MTGREIVEAVRRVGGRVALDVGGSVAFNAPCPLAALVRLHVNAVRAFLEEEEDRRWRAAQMRVEKEEPPFWQIVAALDAELDACLSPPGAPGTSAGPLESQAKRGAAPHPGTCPGTRTNERREKRP